MPLPKIIVRKLQTLEKALRTYVALDGLATTMLGILLLLALSFLLDRFFEFSQGFRLLMLLAMFGTVGSIIWFRIIRRAFAVIRKEQLAMVLEHYVPGLNETLITTVEHVARPDEVAPVLLNETVRKASQRLRNVDVRHFFRYGRLTLRILAAVLLFGLAIGLCTTFSETASLWFSRNILLSRLDWPRRSRLVVDGIENNRVRIGRGDSFTLTVRADARMPLVPDALRLRLGSKESGFRTLSVDQFQTETKDGTDWRVFSHTFGELLETLPIQVRGADSTIDGLVIEVVPPPILTGLRLHQQFPEYLQRPEREIPAVARMSVPEGTTVRLTARSTKPLVEASVVLNRDEVRLLRRASQPKETRDTVFPAGFDEIEFSLPNLRHDMQIEFRLLDIDNLSNRQPIRLDLSLVKDQIPTVSVRLDGIGSVITPTAILPTVGEANDDNGLDEVRYRYKIEKASTTEPLQPDDAEEGEMIADDAPQSEADPADNTGKTLQIAAPGGMQSLYSLDRSFAVTPLQLQPGDKLTLHVEATDRFDLDDRDMAAFGLNSATVIEAKTQTTPLRVGFGPQWTLEVVTPERLISLLEVREISLRQRFEVLIGEVERTRTMIDEIDLEPSKELAAKADELSLENTGTTDVTTDGADRDHAERQRREELDKRRKNLLETITQDQAGAAQYNVSRSLRDTQKEVYDLKALIESFRQIRREMVNNRIFSDDAEERIDRRIIGPMQILVDADYPETDRLIALLAETLTQRDKPLRPQSQAERTAIIEQFDRLIKKMQAIRDSMVSMESFNEVIEILRSIIKQQQQLRQETQEEKNNRLRNLLGP